MLKAKEKVLEERRIVPLTKSSEQNFNERITSLCLEKRNL